MLNKNFETLFSLLEKHQDKMTDEDRINLIIKTINNNSSEKSTEIVEMRNSEEYKNAIKVLIDNIEHMISKADLLSIFNEFGDKELEDIFKDIKDKDEFVKGFVVFKD
jgi:tRNA(Glu) U13 pseudouridine synthase TruD